MVTTTSKLKKAEGKTQRNQTIPSAARMKPRGKMPMSAGAGSHPDPLLDVRVHRVDIEPSLSGLCVGYEQGRWRAEQFAEHVMDWLPEFALRTSEFEAMSGLNAVPFMRRAARRIYETGKFSNRGEFGELFLHIAVRQVFRAMPAISKIYYKTAINETVKGFDAVHVVGRPGDLELWLGEAKFYDEIGAAIREVVSELADHTENDYLRGEFVLIADKLDDTHPHYAALKKLLSPSTSLDVVFKRACIPVLLTYDSDCLAKHRICDKSYEQAFTAEISANYDRFASKSLPSNLRIHLFLLPLNTKKVLITALDKKLKTWQQV